MIFEGIPFFDLDGAEFLTTEQLLFLGGASGGKAVEDTATGNPLTFSTDLSRPLKSLLIPFTPQQSGTGDPSPQNIRSILPWNGLTVWQNGKDVPISWDAESDGKYIGADGTIGNSTSFHYSNLLSVVKGNYRYTFTASGFSTTRNTRIHGYNSQGQWVEQLTWENTENGTYYMDFVVPVGIDYIRISNAKNVTNESVIETPETDIPFPSPVYGGTLDVVSGVLTVTHALLTKNTSDMNNNEDYPGWKNSGVENIIGTGVNELLRNVLTNVSPVSSLSVGANTAYGSDVLYLNKSYFNKTQSEWKALAIDIQILVPIATPQEQTLTGHQITALVGDNTIWSDADGSMTAVYLKKG